MAVPHTLGHNLQTRSFRKSHARGSHFSCRRTERRRRRAIGTAAHRAKADALEIEANAKRRLADEYDAAQDRGEVRGNNQRTSSTREELGATDIGLSRKDIHEARVVRGRP